LAQPPDITETFVREVDENLRRDQLQNFFKAYGSWLIVAVVLFLGASGGFIWWKQHQVKQSEEQVEKLAQIYQDIGNGSTSLSPQQLDELSKKGSKAVRASALFTRAALALQQNDVKLAIATYKTVAGDGSLPDPYRHAALIRQTALEFDQLKPDEIIARLEPLTKPGEPWFGSAGEMTALAMIKQGRKQEAGQLFVAIAKDQTAPEATRGRATQLASSLGVDTSAALKTQAQ
jgi:hypothetical protein